MTIRLQIPSDDPVILGAFARALRTLAEAHGPIENVEQVHDETIVETTGHGTPDDVDLGVTQGQDDPIENLGGGEQVNTGTGEITNDSTKVDTKNVPFNAELCSVAKEPFYASGARKGQWKKKKGVSDEQYDAWYNGHSLGGGDTPVAQEALDTAGAFGGGSNNAPKVPSDCGSFIVWVSEQQTAGLLTQGQVTGAYNELNLEVGSLFPPNDEATISHNVSNLYNFLTQQIGGGQ